MEEKKNLVEFLWGVVRGSVLNGGQVSLLDEFGGSIRTLPAREAERLRRIADLHTTRLDSSHPPPTHRMEFLKCHQIKRGSFLPTQDALEQFGRELDSFKGEVESKLKDRYERSLYR